ncbi:hypothetical protein GN958_ATG15953 [Phytophthora infestans]|uniref:Uncharacterized protein n=1 Tax=Phytophthora infestans TaxID=4787 RepID=A0A8S9U5J8_PHYIN|nr:hypothetical protein GN958_ATG15953 [Phytophthora infestans]
MPAKVHDHAEMMRFVFKSTSETAKAVTAELWEVLLPWLRWDVMLGCPFLLHASNRSRKTVGESWHALQNL